MPAAAYAPDKVEHIGNGWRLETHAKRRQRFTLWFAFPKGERVTLRVILFTNDMHEVTDRVNAGPPVSWGD